MPGAVWQGEGKQVLGTASRMPWAGSTMVTDAPNTQDGRRRHADDDKIRSSSGAICAAIVTQQLQLERSRVTREHLPA
ncbi:hypothetical protein HaLaN_20171 [Haematococcus lacustris]|uniref:Uncharacterized protein n=1 Tax=Haematococcus lacustris TaxID=44745 RepID=A0A699ZK86_HAELA|nr:hypothetical protein HaLaN_20171 [Haematococcus lacustris]